MSKEEANRFLTAITAKAELREKLEKAQSPQEFSQIAGDLGFKFTPDELKEVVEEHSRGVVQRRGTGIWHWLRNVPWISR